jgi:hypothetical protein
MVKRKKKLDLSNRFVAVVLVLLLALNVAAIFLLVNTTRSSHPTVTTTGEVGLTVLPNPHRYYGQTYSESAQVGLAVVKDRTSDGVNN